MADDGTHHFSDAHRRVERALKSAADSVDVVGMALSPDDFEHLKSVAAARILKVDEALAAVTGDNAVEARHVERVRARQHELRAALAQATYDGERPPDVMTITGEYER